MLPDRLDGCPSKSVNSLSPWSVLWIGGIHRSVYRRSQSPARTGALVPCPAAGDLIERSDYSAGIDGEGHKALRNALYIPGLVARRHNVALKAFGDRLALTGLAQKAVIGAVMRKLVHLIYGVIKSGRPFNMQLAMPKLDLQDGI